MKTPADITRQLFDIVEPVAGTNGYEVVDIEYTTSPRGWVVRVYIDVLADWPHPGGVSFLDCERMSRELSAVLDVEDPIPHAYSLEVSSPGLDRPLRTAAHFARYLGETAKLTLARPLDGRKNFKGRLVAVDPPGPQAREIIIDVDGTEFRLALADIASARLVPDWDAVIKEKAAATRR